jgi:subtilase family serine protease
MQISDFGRRALSFWTASVMLAGCGGSQQALTGAAGALPQSQVASTHAIPQWQAEHLATPACPQDRPGALTCLVLIHSKGQLGPALAGWAPIDFQTRYKLPSSTKGSGQVVAIVDAYDSPNVAGDLAAYRAQFGLGTASFFKYNQTGQQSNYPSGSTGWGVEITLDVEMVSAVCPLCTIDLIEANSSNSSDLEAAEVEAVKLGAHIVSNSWICYGSVSCVNKRDFDTKGVLYLAGSGDSGINQIGAPSALDTVAAVGGTMLSKSGSQYSETVWDGSGGGCATGVKKPKWQHDMICSGRLVSDASAVATNVAEYDTYGNGGWITVDGTSIATPLLAGIFGLAGNAETQEGGRTFWQQAHHRFLYDVCGSSCLFSDYSYGGGWGSPNGIKAF